MAVSLRQNIIKDVKVEVAAKPKYGSGETFALGEFENKKIIFPISNGDDNKADVEIGYIIPEGISNEDALLVPHVASCLWFWDSLGLEIGEAAVSTVGHYLSPMINQIAIWRGAIKVVGLSENDTDIHSEHIKIIDLTDPEKALINLKKEINNVPGVCYVDINGKPDSLDIILESFPQWGRIMLAGNSTEPATIDYYNNIHRTGALVKSCELNSHLIFKKDIIIDVDNLLLNTFQIISNPEMSKICKDLL